MLALPSFPEPAADELEAARERGRRIYETGTSASGELTATLGGQTFELPASALPCVGCHGKDGRGVAEGGVAPSDVTWSRLTRAAEARPNGRARPPYDRRTLVRAVTLGVDSAGRALDPTMPRFRLSHDDARDLVAYLEILGTRPDPGVGPDRLILGTVLPRTGDLSRAVEEVLRAEIRALNESGGLFGRNLHLEVFSPTDSLTEPDVFLWLAPMIGDPRLFHRLDAGKVPVVAPFSAWEPEGIFNHRVFRLLAGPEIQIRILWQEATRRAGEESLPVLLGAAEAAPWAPARVASPRELPTNAGHIVIAERNAETRRWAREVLADDRDPRHLYLPAAVAGPLAEISSPRLHLAFPTLPEDVSPAFERRRRALADSFRLGSDSVVARRLTSVAAGLTFEILRRCGRDARRDGFVQQLERLYAFETGATPPLTFGPNRRVGARGVWIVTGSEDGSPRARRLELSTDGPDRRARP